MVEAVFWDMSVSQKTAGGRKGAELPFTTAEMVETEVGTCQNRVPSPPPLRSSKVPIVQEEQGNESLNWNFPFGVEIHFKLQRPWTKMNTYGGSDALH